MNLRRTTLVWTAVLLVAILFSPGDALAKKKKKRKQPPVTPFVTVAVLPPQVEITRARVLGGVPKIEESGEMEAILLDLVEKGLEDRGFHVKRGLFTPEVFAADPELQQMVTDLQAKFDEVHFKILQGAPRDVEAGRYTLGDAALQVASIVGVEGLVFVRGQGVSTGGGTKAAVFFLTLGGALPGSGIDIRVALVSGADGLLVSYHQALAGGAILKHPREVVDDPVLDAMRRVDPPAPHSEVAPGIPATAPAVPETQPAIPETQPAVPETQPAVPETQPAVPEAQPAVPETQPAVPEAQPAVPEAQPSVPETQPSVPETQPAVPEAQPAIPETQAGVAQDEPGP